MKQTSLATRHDFSAEMMRPITSREIWLSLDDNHCDSRRYFKKTLTDIAPIRPLELDLYHRQLFYWLLIRNGAGIFPIETELHHGVPVQIRHCN